MNGDTISGTVTTTVILGRNGYKNPLAITGTGLILPGTYGAEGIIVPATEHHARITNQGSVNGAYGGAKSGTSGGIGIEFYHDGALSNPGTIAGGQGGYGHETASAGGAGVDLSAGGTIKNSGTIHGGEGGTSNSGSLGAGGAGVQLNGGTLTNKGGIMGGGSADGGSGGHGGNAGVGVYATAGASVVNAGMIGGGLGAYRDSGGSQGGNGVQLNGATLSNTGTVIGGSGGSGYAGGGGTGGAGIVMSGGAVLTNSLKVLGGSGGYGHFSGGTGGNGVDLQSGTFTNIGTVTGGAGGAGGEAYGGIGGTGVAVTGGTLIAGGAIFGGMGGSGQSDHGGAGVTISGATVIASGAIEGGAGATDGDAVQFGSQAGTLVIDPGSAFDGLIAANAAVADVLALGGSPETALSGIGTQYTGFSTLTVEAGASWTLTGSNTLGTGATVLDAGALQVVDGVFATGTLGGEGSVSIGNDGTLTTAGTLSGVALDFDGPGKLVLGSIKAATSTIAGFGTGDVIDAEAIKATTFTYAGGTLTLENGSKPVGQLVFGGSYDKGDFTLMGDHHGGTDIVFSGSDFAGLLGQISGSQTAPAAELALVRITNGWDTDFTWLDAALRHHGGV